MAKHATSKSQEDYALEKAYAHYCRGEFEQVLRVFEKTPTKFRTSIHWYVMAGASNCRLRRPTAAEPLLQKALRRDPNNADALTWMAVLTKSNADPSVPIGYADRAIALRPNDPTGHSVLGLVLLETKEPELAYGRLERAAKLAPTSSEHWHNLAQCCMALRRHDEAIQCYQRAIQLAPKAPQNYLALASALAMFGFVGQAIDTLQDGLQNCAPNAAIHTALANNFTLLRNDEEAEYHHSVARELSPDAELGYGTWLVNQGRFSESAEIFERALAQGIAPGYAYYHLMLGRKLKDREEDRAFLAAMEAVRENLTSPRDRMYLLYALGRAQEQLADFEGSATSYEQANALALDLNRTGPKVPPTRFEPEHREAHEVFAELRDREIEGHPSSSPIFIIGMIRSGTTLLDQILSSHSEVASGGELRFWLEESRKLALRLRSGGEDHLTDLAQDYLNYARLLAGASPRITDKMPLNYQFTGIIQRALPNAKFIHIRRHPVDTCLSIWTTYFGQGPTFAYDKRNIVANYQAYVASMERWRAEIAPDRLMEVDYEDLISRPTEVIPSIVEFLELPWEDACLHHDQNTSAINTPSRWQARQPIYRTSVERWRNFEPWLGEFSELLG